MISGGNRKKHREITGALFSILGEPVTYQKHDGTARQLRAIIAPADYVPLGRRPLPHGIDGFKDWSREDLMATVLELREIIRYFYQGQTDVLSAYKKARNSQLVPLEPIKRKLLADYRQARPDNRIGWCRGWCAAHPTYDVTPRWCSKQIGAVISEEAGASRERGRPRKNTAAR